MHVFLVGFSYFLLYDYNSLGQYENFIPMGDFNVEPRCHSEKFLSNLYFRKCCQREDFIDLIITNRPKSFQNPKVIKNGLSNFHKISLTVMKVSCTKQNPKVIKYRKYNLFSNEAFMNEIECTLLRFSKISFETFKTKHASMKNKYSRSN